MFNGGGRVFGPQPRDYGFKLNRKLKQVARKSALSYKAKENNILVLDQVTFESAKTKSYLQMINNLNVASEKTLLVLPTTDSNVYLSSRNLKKTKVTTIASLNTHDVLNAGKLLFTSDSIKSLEEAFAK